MEIAVSRQLGEAGIALMLGCNAGIIYDIMRIIRRRFPWGWLTFLLDAAFSVSCGIALFVLGMWAGGGQQRLFMVIFAFIGSAIYFTAASRWVLKLLGIVAFAAEKTVCIALSPLKLLRGGVKKIYFLLKNVFHYKQKWYRIKYIQEQYIPKTAPPSRKDAYHESKKKSLRHHN